MFGDSGSREPYIGEPSSMDQLYPNGVIVHLPVSLLIEIVIRPIVVVIPQV